MRNLENKNIIVTGASGGIGGAIIKKLNEAGANILASGTRVDKLEELKKCVEMVSFQILHIFPTTVAMVCLQHSAGHGMPGHLCLTGCAATYHG